MPVYKYSHAFILFYSLCGLVYLPIGVALTAFRLHALAAIFLTTSLLSILYTRRSTARRYFVDSLCYRPPRNVRLSNYLSTRLYILDIVRFVVLLPCFLLAGTSSKIFWQQLVAIAVASFPVISIYPAIEGLIKFHYDWSFRIVLFRRYVTIGAVPHKRYVMPMCGLYGQVLLFTDESLDDAWEGLRERRVRWVIAESYQPLTAEREAQAWQPIVREQLEFADFVVLDWSQDVSPNMEWELATTLKLLPPDRIVVLTAGDAKERVLDLLKRLELSPRAYRNIFAPAPKDSFTNLLLVFKMQKAFSALTLSSRPEFVGCASAEAGKGSP
jgi:hypothetical protein